MKSELKYFATYLPYGVKVRNEMWPNSIQVLNTINITRFISYEAHKTKLILKAISTENENCISENDLSETKCHSRLRLIAMVKTNSLYHFKFEYLVSQHYDVFGLIDAGLAIDINTIKS